MALFHCVGDPVPNGRAIVCGDTEEAARDALKLVIINNCKENIAWLANRMREDITNIELAEIPNPELLHRLNEIETELRRMAQRHQAIVQGE
jgi:hypothetical protein